MNDSILQTLLETGIAFVEKKCGTVDYRLFNEYRDENLSLGEGYNLVTQIGETRGIVKLKFESFSNFLVSEAKELLVKNISSLGNYKSDGQFFIENSKGRKLLDSIEANDDFASGDFEILFESSMRDLRKEKEIEILVKDIASVAQLLVFAVLPYKTESYGEIEGKEIEVTTTKYERSRKNRALCLAHHGYSCNTCGFNFEMVYGDLAKNYIHVHHIEQISDTGEKKIDPVKDLIPLCPNCHAVAHLKNPPLLPDEIKKLLKVRNESI